MKLEDYDVVLTDSEEELDESEDFSLGQSIGGESFYKYTPSAEVLYSKRYKLQLQITTGGKSGSRATPKLTSKSRSRSKVFRKSVEH